MRILIIGTNGMLGSDLFEQLKGNHELHAINRSGIDRRIPEPNSHLLDISDPEKTFAMITRINPDVVINTAAVSNVDECERSPDTAYRVNSLGVRNIALACQRFDTVLCHVSTDYVFSGENTPKDGYCEFDSTGPRSVYGKSKYRAEFYIKHLLNKFYIVRSSLFFGRKRQSFADLAIKSISEGKPVPVVRDQYGSPSYTKDLAGAIALLIQKPLYGIYHLSNGGGASRQEFVEEIFKIMGKNTGISLMEREKIYFAPRPRDSRLNNQMWHLEGFKPLRPWQDALREYVKEKQK
jgi:dTDP-4-dehydrorhamnose reductase